MRVLWKQLAKDIDTITGKCAGLDNYQIRKFVQALEALPKQLAGNAGLRVLSYWNDYFIRLIIGLVRHSLNAEQEPSLVKVQ